MRKNYVRGDSFTTAILAELLEMGFMPSIQCFYPCILG